MNNFSPPISLFRGLKITILLSFIGLFIFTSIDHHFETTLKTVDIVELIDFEREIETEEIQDDFTHWLYNHEFGDLTFRKRFYLEESKALPLIYLPVLSPPPDFS